MAAGEKVSGFFRSARSKLELSVSELVGAVSLGLVVLALVVWRWLSG